MYTMETFEIFLKSFCSEKKAQERDERKRERVEYNRNAILLAENYGCTKAPDHPHLPLLVFSHLLYVSDPYLP